MRTLMTSGVRAGLTIAVAAVLAGTACAATENPAPPTSAEPRPGAAWNLDRPERAVQAAWQGGGTQVIPAAVVAALAAQDAARPVRLRVPSLGISAPVIKLKLDKKGRLAAPKGYAHVGWNVAGPEPGERGAAVIAGHVDSRTGPAVFYRLRQVKKGATIRVERADGTTVAFTVRRMARYPKNRIPNSVVYGKTKSAQLRLITCSGTFDRDRRSYRDNLVVFADRARVVR